ncbi:hypothetical protein HK100_002490, partial [Physocladia obscura]
MTSLFGLGTFADVEVVFSNEAERKFVETRQPLSDKDRAAAAIEQPNSAAVSPPTVKRMRMPLYYDGEPVAGKVLIRVKDAKKMDHQGIKIEFVGCIGAHTEFLSLSQDLTAAGELRASATYDFEFKHVEKQFESYYGINVKLRYFCRVTISRRISDITKERDVWVYSYRAAPDVNNSIKMEVGIEDALHIEFEYNKS